jgi:Putative auto-transporter adhesin, head GIN domain
MEIQALKTLDATISGSGDITYKGNPSVNAQVTGSGRVRKF